jgi:ParB family transcriptional regulator, chromosome partitioning protein
MVKTPKSERPYRELRSLGGISSLYDVTPTHQAAQPATSGECCIPLDQIQRSGNNPRKSFDAAKLAQLTASVQRYGVLEPVLLTPLRGGQEPVQYELVVGERRYLAAQSAGLSEVRARILTPDEIQQWKEVDLANIRLMENLNREDLNAVEETHAIVELLALQLQMPIQEIPRLLYRLHQQHRKQKSEKQVDASHTRVGMTSISALNGQLSQWLNSNDDAVIFERVLWEVEYVFEGLGRFSWQSFVQHRLPLLNLPVDVQNAIRAGQLPYSAGKSIARLTDEAQRQELLTQAIAEDWTRERIAEAVRLCLEPGAEIKNEEAESTLQFRSTLQTAMTKLKKANLSPQQCVKAEKLLQQLLLIVDSSR